MIRDFGMTDKGEAMYFVYIITNKINSVMYVGVTNDLARRIGEHKSELIEGFTKRYHLNQLIYFEEYLDVNEAIAREKQIKGYSRAKKNELVNRQNPEFKDWCEQLI